MADLKEELSTCAICFDAFLHPKLLSCRHTFCKPCLSDYTKKKEIDEILCPICRQKQCLDEKGLDGLMDNYFVSLRSQDISVIQRCNICSEEADINCHHCTRKPRHFFNLSHNLVSEMSGQNTGSDSDTEDTDESGSHSPEDDQRRAMFQAMDFPPKTLSIAELVSSFEVPFTPEDKRPKVTCIFPKSKNTCLVILGMGPEMIECTLKGRPFVRKVFSEGIHGITKTIDGKILFSNIKEYSILQMVDESRLAVFAKYDGFEIMSLSTFRDGRIAAVGMDKTNMYYLRHRSESHGTMLIFDIHGKLRKESSKHGGSFLFKMPLCVSVNPHNDTVCVADGMWQQVLILTEDGSVIGRYRGTNPSIAGRLWEMTTGLRHFIPTAVCHDQDGNLVVANFAGGSLHVLLPNGELCGFINTKTNRGFGSPTSLCFDGQNRIWVGHDKGKVKIFEFLCFKNNLFDTFQQ